MEAVDAPVCVESRRPAFEGQLGLVQELAPNPYRHRKLLGIKVDLFSFVHPQINYLQHHVPDKSRRSLSQLFLTTE
jgi:hypothetical protein